MQNKNDNTQQTKETKINYISFNGLKSNTSYELRVFIKTHVGYNPDYYLSKNFETKPRSEFL